MKNCIDAMVTLPCLAGEGRPEGEGKPRGRLRGKMVSKGQASEGGRLEKRGRVLRKVAISAFGIRKMWKLE